MKLQKSWRRSSGNKGAPRHIKIKLENWSERASERRRRKERRRCNGFFFSFFFFGRASVTASVRQVYRSSRVGEDVEEAQPADGLISPIVMEEERAADMSDRITSYLKSTLHQLRDFYFIALRARHVTSPNIDYFPNYT